MKIQHQIALLSLFTTILGVPLTRAQTVPISTRIPVADNTIGTQVLGGGGNFAITGGQSRGQNVFHSFQDFSVPTKGSATFLNPIGNRSIITRVTGNQFSDIDGTIDTQGANFFLINPNGMVFGANTKLNVGQTFLGSTANGIDFVDAGGKGYRFGVNGNDAPLLTINPNALLTPARLILGGGSGEIRNSGTLETTNPSQYIGLIGGNVSLNGGPINASGGRVELGGLSAPGTVTLGVDGNNLRSQFPTNVSRADVSLTNQAGVNVAGAGGGDIAITGRNIEILNRSVVRAGIEVGLGTPEAIAGNIKLNATGDIALASNSAIQNNVRLNSRGNAGNIEISTTGNLTISGTNDRSLIEGFELQAFPLSSVTSNIYGAGNSGKVAINTKGDLIITNRGGINSGIAATTGIGNSQGISITARNLSLTNLSSILSDNSGGKGNGGNIDISTTGDLTIFGTNNQSVLGITQIDGVSAIASSTSGIGDTGKITIDTKGNLSISNLGGILSSIYQSGSGNSQGISITAKNLSLANSSNIRSSNEMGKGNAGNITIQTTGNLTISGTKNQPLLQEDETSLSTISSSTNGLGDTGKITIDAKANLFVENRSGITSNVRKNGIGNSQGIKISTGNLSLINSSGIQSGNFGGKGNGGNIDISTTGDINIAGTDDQSRLQGGKGNIYPLSNISTSTDGQGNAGKIIINAKSNFSIANRALISTIINDDGVGNSQGISIAANNLNLRNFTSIQSGNSGGKGDAGNIEIASKGNVNVTDVSLISSQSSGQGKAADILINSNRLNLLNQGGISAVAVSANGGNIQIIINERLILRNESDISTTSGTSGKNGNGGNISIIAPNGFIVAAPSENSDITANAFSGSGGKVSIKTQQNFWISPLSRSELEKRLGTTVPNQLNPARLNTNDITAISQVNPSLSGQISITPPQIDITAGLSPLPNNVTDPTNQINPNCSAKAIANNSFTSVGRGGIPATPKDPLNEQEIATNWVKLNSTDTLPSTPIATTTPASSQPYGSAQGKPIVEAQGWQRERNGDIVLVAGSSFGKLLRPAQQQSGCPVR
jgi:filamentous hemagglutinin family protein